VNIVRTPFAIQLFDECVRGKKPEQLSAETGIPLDRIRSHRCGDTALQETELRSFGHPHP
jgi:hypothetical protein